VVEPFALGSDIAVKHLRGTYTWDILRMRGILTWDSLNLRWGAGRSVGDTNAFL
jgi:hypothetical protein